MRRPAAAILIDAILALSILLEVSSASDQHHAGHQRIGALTRPAPTRKRIMYACNQTYELVKAVPHRFDDFRHDLVSALRRAPRGDRTSLQAAFACVKKDPEAWWLEFGVWRGASIKMMASERPELDGGGLVAGRPAVVGFDSFRGLPEAWRDIWRPTLPSSRGPPAGRSGAHSRGDLRLERRKAATIDNSTFDIGGRPPFLPPALANRVQWEIGWFNESLPRFMAKAPFSSAASWVSLLHVDCDLYSSTKTVLDLLAPHLVAAHKRDAGGRWTHGSVLVFDDLVNYPEYAEHELLALYQFLVERRLAVEVLAHPTNRVALETRLEMDGQTAALRLIRPHG